MTTKEWFYVILILQDSYFVKEATNSTKLWWIPISFISSEDDNDDYSLLPRFWLSPSTDEFTLNITDDSWIVLNNEQSVDMRINYDEKLWTSIIRLLERNHTALPLLTRAQLVDDSLNLFIDGKNITSL